MVVIGVSTSSQAVNASIAWFNTGFWGQYRDWVREREKQQEFEGKNVRSMQYSWHEQK